MGEEKINLQQRRQLDGGMSINLLLKRFIRMVQLKASHSLSLLAIMASLLQLMRLLAGVFPTRNHYHSC